MRKFGAVTTTFVFALSAAFASEGNNGNPEYSSSAYGNYSTNEASVYIDGATGSGSGALYNVESYMNNGTQTLVFNVATAAHVVTDESEASLSMGLHFGNGLFTLGSANAETDVEYRGSGFYSLPEDLAYVSFSTTESQVGSEDWTFLNTLVGQNPTLAVGGAQNAALTNYGYGLSGKYLVDDYDPTTGTHQNLVGDFFTPGAQANGDILTGLGYESESDFGAQYGSGIDRMTNTTSNGIFDYTNNTYQYNAVEWTLEDSAGHGQINSGDSGGAIMSNGKIIGLNTFAVGSAYTLAGGVSGEDFYYGSQGGGLAFTQGDINWLDEQAMAAAPEPATVCGLALAGLALVRRRRKN